MSVKLDFLSQKALIEIIGSGEDRDRYYCKCCSESEWFFELFECIEKIQVFPQGKQNRVKSRQNLLISFIFTVVI